MKVLMISTDKKIFDKNSAVTRRMIEYGGLVNELHIVVFTNQQFEANPKIQISNNVFAYPTNSRNRWFYVFDAIRAGKKINNIDLVTTQDPFETGLAGWRITRACDARLNLQIHTDFLSPYFAKNNLLNKIREQIAKFLLPKADSIRVVSERIKNSLIDANIIKDWTKITILPVFTDIEYIKRIEPSFKLHEKYPQFDFIILMASRLSEEKNVLLAIDAFKKVKEKYPKTGLVIVGEGVMREVLMRRTTSYKLQANIIFEPWSLDLISYYKTADLFLNTSNYEGYGLTLIEAAASGCPITTTDVGLVGGIIGKDNSLVCPVGDGDCVANKIILAIENKAIREKLSEYALKAVSAVAISKEDYLKMYKRSWEKSDF